MLPTIFLDQNGVVMAVFLRTADATEYASISNHKYCAMPFNVNNSDKTPLPQVGSIFKA